MNLRKISQEITSLRFKLSLENHAYTLSFKAPPHQDDQAR